jgi:hypothetical protein
LKEVESVAKQDPVSRLISRSAYARHRHARGLPGGTPQAVCKAVDEGVISAVGPQKLIDPVVADRC